MESFICHVNTHFSSSPISKIPSTHLPPSRNLRFPGGDWRLRQPWGDRKSCKTTTFECAKGVGSVWEIENKIENEMGMGGIEKLSEKCKGVGGIVELLECLEREAIMGEDEGKEPMDYNRRAHIFEESSRVFQALKESGSSSSTY